MRKTLKKYVGKRIRIVGTYDGPPVKHEKTGIEYDKESGDYPRYRKNTIISPNSESSKLPYKSPIWFPEKASCLKNVRGIEEFSEIEEDHVNIQEDIGALYFLARGDQIKLEGLVGEYYTNARIDYCLIEVQRILN